MRTYFLKEPKVKTGQDVESKFGEGHSQSEDDRVKHCSGHRKNVSQQEVLTF